MVVSMSHDKLVEILIDPIPDHMEIREIHRSSLYRANLSSWDRCLIGRGVKICKNSSFVVKDGTSVIAEEVEISMVCQVHRCVRIGKDTVCQRQHILVCQRICDGYDGVSRISLISVRAQKYEGDSVFRLFFRVPETRVIVIQTTVQVVRAIVHRQGILFSVQGELSFRGAVCDPAHNGSEMRAIV